MVMVRDTWLPVLCIPTLASLEFESLAFKID